MKSRIFVLPVLGIIGILVAAGCGGSEEDAGGSNGSDEPAIRVEKGLAVAPTDGEGSSGSSGGVGVTTLPLAVPAPDLAASARSSYGLAYDSMSMLPSYYPYMPAQASQTGLTVQGFGKASASADSAVLEMVFGSNVAIEPKPLPPDSNGGSSGGRGVAPAQPSAVQPITEADLKPVVDAIAGQGVSREDIEVITGPKESPGYSMATVRATIRNVSRLESVVNAANNAASNLSDISPQGSNVMLTVSDCGPLERAAMQAAVEDARARSSSLAEVLQVRTGGILGASHYSYSPYGGTACASHYGGPAPALRGDTAGPNEVQVATAMSVTFAIQ